MATTPITGVTLPNSTSTDQVPADLMAAFTAAEKMWLGTFASAPARDAKVTAPTAGMVAWISSPGKVTVHDGSNWIDLFDPTPWTAWTPTLQSTGGIAFNLGTNATQIGRYQRSGKSAQFQCTWNFGSSVSGPGGNLVFQLPPGLPGANVSALQQTGPCTLWIPNLSRTFQGFWTILPGGTVAYPHFPVGTNDCSMDSFRDTTDGSTSATGVPHVTGTAFDYPIQVNGTLVASGIYQTA